MTEPGTGDAPTLRPGAGGGPPGPPPILILNPVAGAVTGPEMVERVERAATEIFHTRPVLTGKVGDARRLARAARLRGTPEVVVVGGDGTVNEVVRGLRDVEGSDGHAAPPLPTLTIIPLGTGNDLARCLGIPLDWDTALTRARHPARIRRIDLLEVELEGQPGLAVNAVVVGSGGRVGQVLDPEEKERWGPLSYLRSAAEVALHLEPMSVRIAVDDGTPEEMSVLNVVAANGRYAARGVPIAPHADPADGTLELVLIREVGMRALLAMAPTLLREEDPEHEAYEHRHVRTVTVEALGADRLPVSVDGETESARTIRVAVLPGVLPVRIPGT